MKGRHTLFFLLGLAAGAGVFWLLFSDEGKKLMNDIRLRLDEMKEELGEDYSGIKKVFDEWLTGKKEENI